ncbi:hypothetical protein [Pararhodobacter marinus]|uniref:hypothetical protein n=1 Tax=Pararhodobacter marinus TaxID=2184063 RepID=UPI0035116C7D
MTIRVALVLIAVLAASPLTAQSVPQGTGTPVAASVGLPPMTAPGGVTLTVDLGPEAPRAAQDLIRIARPGAPVEDDSGGATFVPVDGAAIIASPAEPGSWELRYVGRENGTERILGSSALTVVGPDYK